MVSATLNTPLLKLETVIGTAWVVWQEAPPMTLYRFSAEPTVPVPTIKVPAVVLVHPLAVVWVIDVVTLKPLPEALFVTVV